MIFDKFSSWKRESFAKIPAFDEFSFLRQTFLHRKNRILVKSVKNGQHREKLKPHTLRLIFGL